MWTLSFVALLSLLPAELEKPPIPTREVWYDFKFKGSKVGYLYAKDEPTEVNGQPAIHLHRYSVVVVNRQKDVIRMESTTDTWFGPDGAPMRFKHARIEGAEKRNVDGYRDGDVFVVSRTVGKDERTERISLEKGKLRLASSLEILFIGSGLEVGKKLSGFAIDEAEAQRQPFSLAITGKEGDDFVLDETLGPVNSRALVAPDGHVKKTELLGIGAEFVETTKENAIKMGATVDIFDSALFKIPEALPPGDDLDSIEVRIKGKAGKRPRYISEGKKSRQHATNKGKDFVDLTIRANSAPRKSIKLPIKNRMSYLKETPYEALKDERLVATVRKVVGDETDFWTAAKNINRFVYTHIENKSLARAFASAIEALESKEGDCTEHAVLFSALAKIAGIPTRLATGLVFVGGPKHVFGYHEWVEVWTGSEWIAMDPTFGQDIADPTHIKFADGQSDPDGLREAGMVAAALIGDMELQVLSYVTVSGQKKTF
jgi:hypothetical protein